MAPGFAGEAITLGGTLENTPAAGQAPAPQQLGAASAQVLATWQGGLGTGRPEEASVAIDEWLSSFSRTLYWVDNHNEAALRPDTAQYPQPILKFRLDGTGECSLRRKTWRSLACSRCRRQLFRRPAWAVIL